MLQLRTLGGLTLATEDGPLTGTATQRRKLALLTLLAVSHDKGLSRDKVMSYLWPESDTAKARHGLNQLLYAQRRHLGDDRLFLGEKTLRLNPDLIWNDVGEFEHALDHNELEKGVALYRGPFLDGFFLRDAPQFERWTESQRERFAARCLSALRALAQAATAGGDAATALSWLQRAKELNPLDTTVTIDLVHALASSGNPAEAVRQADLYQHTLQREMGLPPDARLLEFVRQLKSAPKVRTT